MPEVNKILFALELVEAAADVAEWVNLMAEKFQADIYLLHVVPEIPYPGFPYAVDRPADVEALVASAEKSVISFRDAHIGDAHPTRVSVVSGDPAEQILACIENHGISIVAMGTHGRKGLSRAIFGSVTDRVLRTSPVPVFCIISYRAESESSGGEI